MKLIDAIPIIEKYKNYEYFSGYEDFDDGVETGVLSIIDELENASEIDPIHAAGGIYCKECQYYKSYEFPESGRIIYQCYNSSASYLEEYKPDDFCSKGVSKDGKTY